jgi:hypothetical protein
MSVLFGILKKSVSRKKNYNRKAFIRRPHRKVLAKSLEISNRFKSSTAEFKSSFQQKGFWMNAKFKMQNSKSLLMKVRLKFSRTITGSC